MKIPVEAMAKIQKALADLGVNGEVTAKPIDSIRYIIIVDKKEFGVFDTDKDTFVD